MALSSSGTIRHRLLATTAVFLAGIAHGVHDTLEGDPPGGAFLPLLSMTAQVVALSAGEELARRRQWNRWWTLAVAVLVSLVFGYFTVLLHPRPADPKAAYWMWLWIPIVPWGVLGFWLLMRHLATRLESLALTAEKERRKAELAQLRASLHPHFLLNTLNAIAGLLVAEPRQARQLVSALGDLLRDSLEERGETASLGEEIEWLRRYAEIFQIRHRGFISFEWDLARETLTLPIPRLLLQPLLENAIRHGALKRPGGGRVTVLSRSKGQGVEITVKDDGPGMHARHRSGLGHRLVEDRLKLACPTATMTIDSGESGTSVTLQMPIPNPSP